MGTIGVPDAHGGQSALTGVTDSCELLPQCWEWKQPVLWSLQPHLPSAWNPSVFSFYPDTRQMGQAWFLLRVGTPKPGHKPNSCSTLCYVRYSPHFIDKKIKAPSSFLRVVVSSYMVTEMDHERYRDYCALSGQPAGTLSALAPSRLELTCNLSEAVLLHSLDPLPWLPVLGVHNEVLPQQPPPILFRAG